MDGLPGPFQPGQESAMVEQRPLVTEFHAVNQGRSSAVDRN
jgi:hypothetical protein